MAKLTQLQAEVLRLIARTKQDEDGWCKCASGIFVNLVKPMPSELVETRLVDGKHEARLTHGGNVLLKWTC